MTTPFAVASSPFLPGISLVEASAGTGKTFNIAMSVVRLLLEERNGRFVVDGIGNILVVTFTNAATDELVTRIRTFLRLANDVYQGRAAESTDSKVQLFRQLASGRELLAQDRVAAALAAVDTLAVFTIHGFCKRVLEEFALESGTPFGAALIEDPAAMVDRAMQDWWRRTFYTDAALAAYAVTQGWKPTQFLKAYRAWQQFPDVVLEPSVDMTEARRTLDAAIAQLAAEWSEPGFRARVNAIVWNKTAPLFDAASRDALVHAVSMMRDGSLSAAAQVASTLSVAALEKGANKRLNANKPLLAALPDWPVAQAATHLQHALTVLQQALRVDCLRATKAAIEQEKAEQNVLGFDDLLATLSGVLQEQGSDGLLAQAIRRQFQAALIDEFQDTDQHQFRIFNTAFAGHPLFLIGDPKQAIYAFRGADVHAYLGAAKQAQAVYSLESNYRSTPPMVNAVNALFGRRPQPFVEAEIGYHPSVARHHVAAPNILEGEHALHWWFVPPNDRGRGPEFTTSTEARRMLFAACVDSIVRHVANGWQPRSMAVLVRTKNEGLAVADLLRQARVPAVVSGLGDVTQSDEMHELQLVLEAIATPRHLPRVRAALVTHVWGLSHAGLLRLNEPAAERDWEAVIETLSALHETWRTHGLRQVLQRLFAQRRVAERILAYTDGERRLTNLRHAAELLHGAQAEGQLNIEGVLRWLATSREAGADEQRTVPEFSELRLETDADAVQIVTIHKSKGLEYDLVFCPTLWTNFAGADGDDVLVHEGDRVVFDHGSPERDRRRTLANVERLAEECRLVYVALTRARFRTYVGWGPIGSKGKRGAWDAGLSYLLYDGVSLDAVATRDLPKTVSTALEQDCTTWGAMLESLVQQHDAIMRCEALSAGVATQTAAPPTQVVPPFVGARLLPADTPLRQRFDTFVVSSFTALAAGAHGADAVRDAARDHVADVDDAVPPAIPEFAPSDFRAFPAGRRPGVILHTLFETSRFDDSMEVLRSRVTAQLVRDGLASHELDPRIDGVVQMMCAVFEQPLGPWPVTLAQVSSARCRHEWEFLLPLASAEHAFTRAALATCFETYGGPAGARYATALRRLGGGRVHGFLTGFVDLLFEHEGRWFVVDWKSNQLGSAPDAYGEAALAEAMEQNHYTLQYHLYLVALHRFLQQRLPAYDYDMHIGGAAYAFLRGFAAGASVTGHGWYTDRPSRALIEALSQIIHPAPVVRAS